jgi:hypothetical protein
MIGKCPSRAIMYKIGPVEEWDVSNSSVGLHTGILLAFIGNINTLNCIMENQRFVLNRNFKYKCFEMNVRLQKILNRS